MAEQVPSEDQFYIVSVIHTQRSHRYITLWRPDNRGYAWPLSWAGKYARATVEGACTYYNGGDNNIAVQCEVIDALAVAPEKGRIDNDAGPVLLNNAANWKAILAATISKPRHAPRPEYRGAPRAVGGQHD